MSDTYLGVFDGSNDYMTFSPWNFNGLGNALAWRCRFAERQDQWIFYSSSLNNRIFITDDGDILRLNSNGTSYDFDISGVTVEAFHTYEIWRDSGTHRFYLDGTLMQSLSGNTTGAAQAFTAFGRKTSTPDQTINAEVDWVKFYNAGRSLIRHYDYSDQTGTNVTNIHDPGTNDATLVNTTAETFWGSIPEPGLGHRIASWSNHHNTPGRRTRPGIF